MLPPGSPASTAVPGTYIAPDDADRALLQDYELGGVALEDTSLGLSNRIWRMFFDPATKDVKLAPASGSPVTTLFNAPQLTELTFTFDQAMRPAVAYVEAGVTKLRWYDSVPAAIVTDAYFNVSSPFLCLDERRPVLLAGGDMLFFYIRDRRVYYRQQRDRFEVEYPQMTEDLPVGKSRITNVGVTNELRLQVTVKTEST